MSRGEAPRREGVFFDDGWSARPTKRPSPDVVESPAAARHRLRDAPPPGGTPYGGVHVIAPVENATVPPTAHDSATGYGRSNLDHQYEYDHYLQYDEYHEHDQYDEYHHDDGSSDTSRHSTARHDDAPLTRRQLKALLDRRERLERPARKPFVQLPLRRRVPRRSTDLDSAQHGTPSREFDVHLTHPGSQRDVSDERNAVPRHHDRVLAGNRRLDPPSPMTRPTSAPLQGVALLTYFALLPYVIWTKWSLASRVSHGWILRDALSGLALFWILFVALVVAYLLQMRRRQSVPRNGLAWVAGGILTLLPFLLSSSAGAHGIARPAAPVTVSASVPASTVSTVAHHGDLARLPLALLAVSRRRRLSAHPTDADDPESGDFSDVDPHLLARLSEVLPSDLGGVVEVGEEISLVDPSLEDDPLICSLLYSPSSKGIVVSYARPGGVLHVDEPVSVASLEQRIHPLHRGDVVVVESVEEAWRTLALRSVESRVVVVLRPSNDPDLLARVVRVTTDTPAPGKEVRVELLRPLPLVTGLKEPFVPTLRRRCVEMVAYLALHPGEPVTGERLRTRVLANAQIDASRATLANTATSVRRSLGARHGEWRLAPVGPSGLYELSGVQLDVAEFHLLVADARRSEEPYDLLVQALRLVQGEPLASVLKGYEWFRFEGHLAQLQREGELAALALVDLALERDQPEVALWALRQGLLIDPESPRLLEELERAPRLSPLRSRVDVADRGREAAGRWALERFGPRPQGRENPEP